MKKLVFLYLLLIQIAFASAQTGWQPDTVLSIYGEHFLSTENFFEFGDKSKVISLLARDSISSQFNDTTLNVSASYLEDVRATFVIDSNLQITRAIGMPWHSPFQAQDSIYASISTGWNDTIDINPAGSPVYISSNTTLQKNYLCVYDKHLNLVRHHLAHQNTFASGKVVAVDNGKIIVAVSERDPNINGQNLGTGRQRIKTFSHSGTTLSDKIILSRYGTTWSYTMLDWLIPSDAGGYYAYLSGASPGDQIDLNLNPASTQIQPVQNGDDTWVVKLDQNLDFIWGTKITYQSGSILSAKVLIESNSSDSLLLIGYGGSANLIYEPVGGSATTIPGNAAGSNMQFRIKISKTSGQLGSTNLGHQFAAYQQGNMLMRFAKNYKSFTGVISQEYLNINDNTFAVPDSQTVLAIYSDATLGTPSEYRILGAHGVHRNSGAHAMRMSNDGSQVHVIGYQTGDFLLDTAYTSILPDLNAGATLFFARFTKTGLTTQLEPQQRMGSFKVFPNPCKDLIHVEMEENRAREIALLDIHGRMLQAWKWDGLYRQQIDLSAYPAAMYFIQVELPNGDKLGKRIIKQ